VKFPIFATILMMCACQSSGNGTRESLVMSDNEQGQGAGAEFVQCSAPTGNVEFYPSLGKVQFVDSGDANLNSVEKGLVFDPKFLEVAPPIYAMIISKDGERVGSWQAKRFNQPTEVKYRDKTYSNCQLLNARRDDDGSHRAEPASGEPTGSYAECSADGNRTIRFYTNLGRVYYATDKKVTELSREGLEFTTAPSPLEIFPPFYETSITEKNKSVGRWSRQMNSRPFDVTFLGNTFKQCTWFDR
jgi:hypothetical protein